MIGHAMPVYRGYATQQGHGIGNVLSGLARFALPVIGKVARAAGSKLLESGLDYVSSKLKPKRVKRVKRIKRSTSHPKVTHKRKGLPGPPEVQTKERVQETFFHHEYFFVRML